MQDVVILTRFCDEESICYCNVAGEEEDGRGALGKERVLTKFILVDRCTQSGKLSTGEPF